MTNFVAVQAPIESQETSVEAARKNERVVMWKLYGSFHRHNTLCSFVAVVEDLNFLKKNKNLSYNEKVLYYMRLPHHIKLHFSAGMLGFRKSNRAEYEAAYQVSTRLFKAIEEKNLLAPSDKIEIVLKDFGKGREAFSSALQGKEGAFIRPHVVRVTDNTKLKFGGARPKKVRRL
ncbi:translational machinery component [Metschnikowia bicuspidata var. bicuspidata NRRL YB-4993]|uniref:Small ribosomal subunit protein uS11m n=1 Tax=Metschnikowia bicuspidata var. bicuspidata NRRL YB-4993 TaxID=869754 RepID=A0A1A0H6D2_9ASCO|nr:translational machinery component [Metschnikowia bicuspidata var. bicuspidata NRRL YB-4993]OBA19473.1 translational machinery component [Metschnikowia bicuspidata var. bicuspidata NRRL YB-4993]